MLQLPALGIKKNTLVGLGLHRHLGVGEWVETAGGYLMFVFPYSIKLKRKSNGGLGVQGDKENPQHLLGDADRI